MGKKSTPESFWARVSGSRSERNGCWNWTGSTNNTGYGTLVYHGRAATAHRVAAFLLGLVDDIAAPKNRKGVGFVLHQCDNKLCCNPKHMRIGTYAQNQLEAYGRKRRAAHKGTAHTNAKHTPKSIALIKDMYAHGVSQEAIAKLLQVSQTCVSKIIRGESYAETV
jgi:hypothetical protein